MEEVLNVVVEADALVKVRVLARELLELLRPHLPGPEGAPQVRVGSAKEVAEIAEEAVGAQPELSLRQELLVARGLEGLGAVLGEHIAEELELGVHHVGEVDRVVELHVQVGVPLLLLVVVRVVELLNLFVDLRLEPGAEALDLGETQVLRVQGIDGDGALRVAVLRRGGSVADGVGDRQELEQLEA